MIGALIHRPESLFDEIRDAPSLGGLALKLTAVTVFASMLFGASLGFYVGGVQIPLAAVKVPISLLATLAITFGLMHLINVVLHPRLRAAQSLALALIPVAVMSIILAAAAPIMCLATATFKIPSYPSYLFLILFGVGWGAVGGGFGVWVLLRGMRRVVGPEGRPGRTVALWVVAYQFVGAQCNWLLRPWIGDSTQIDGLFSLTRNLEGNFYVAVYKSVLTFLDRIT